MLYISAINDDANIIGEGNSNDCIRGFPYIPISEVGSRTDNSIEITVLIPEMNFTCDASIIGFTVAGKKLDSWPHSIIEIWRKNIPLYYQAGSGLSVNIADRGVCVTMGKIAGDTSWCILRDHLQISVQPGDILGLKLPSLEHVMMRFSSQMEDQ